MIQKANIKKAAIMCFAAFVALAILCACNCVAPAFAADASTHSKIATVALSDDTDTDDVLVANEVAKAIRSKLVAREESFTLQYTTDNNVTSPYSFWDEVYEHTGNPHEGDYLAAYAGYGYKSWYCMQQSDGSYLNTCTIVPYYWYYNSAVAAAAAEEFVDMRCDEILATLNLDNQDEYTRIDTIYDWVISNIEYDFDTSSFTAYAGLADGKCVCCGYATLVYRLMLQAGIDCRCINGYGNGEEHSWNIVRIQDKYYNIDACWDAQWVEFNKRPYFLKTDSDYSDHIRNSEYCSYTFNSKYPMSQRNFVGYEYFIRLSGEDRYETAALAAAEQFSACESIVLVSGGSYPDALCASGLAGVLEAPILLTSSTSLSEPAYDEIVRLNAEHIIIVGGENSVSSEIELELEQNGFSVSRIAGADRYETSYNVYKAATNSWGSRSGSNSKTAIIVSGSNYADALSASSYAWWSTSPIFLVNGNGLTEKVKVSIAEDGFARAIVVGGASSVSASLGDDLKSTGISVKRLSGNDRYETSVAFATWALGEGMSFNNAGIATGKNFPDALAGGALCGKCSSVILLADIDGGTQAVDTLATHKDEISRLYYLGGENSVTPELCNLIESALKG